MGGAALLVTANAIGWRNPGNFLYVHRALFHPFLSIAAGMVVVLVVGVDRIKSRWIRIPIAAGTILLMLIVVLTGTLTFAVDNGNHVAETSSSFGDTKAHFVEGGILCCDYDLVLRADRGMATRENEALSLDTLGAELGWMADHVDAMTGTPQEAGHTLPTAEFVGQGELVVRLGATTVDVVFDPHTLDVDHIECEAKPTVTDTGAELTYQCPRHDP